MSLKIPSINTQFICIVDHKQLVMAAVISSYLSKQDYYFPLFEFPSVTSKYFEVTEDDVTEHELSRRRGEEFSTFVNNAIARMRTCDYLILAGLSDDQKSYMDFIKLSNVIEINTISEVDFFLSPFIDEKPKLRCGTTGILNSLLVAERSNSILVIDETLDSNNPEIIPGKGVVVLEEEPFVASVIAVNYAFSIDANIFVTKRVTEDERTEVMDCIECWQNGDENKYTEIDLFVNSLIDLSLFEKIPFATFFTIGIPYSLVLKNSIPCSYVDMHMHADLFIINNLLFDNKYQYVSAVVFSPEFFETEETKQISQLLSSKHFFVKELIGKDATVLNLDMHLKEFPYAIFHICSHGGEIDGYTVQEKFVDRDNNLHTIIYDEVLSLSPSARSGLIAVQGKQYFKIFDGFKWRSTELKKQNIPEYVFADMQNAMRISNASQKIRSAKKKIPNSCAIQCVNTSHQGMISTVAMHTSPFIFNNTCWSWYHIAQGFLSGGVRGYLGTLWKIQNDHAVEFANEFYKNISFNTIQNAVHISMNALKGTASENIYIFWGLHFTSITLPKHPTISKVETFSALIKSYDTWERKLNSVKKKASAEIINDYLNWINEELSTTFKNEFEFYKKIKK